MGLEELLGEVLEVFLGGDELLTGEDGAAIVFCQLGINLVLDVARSDGGVPAPDVHFQREIVANEGNLVVLNGCVNDGKGAGAGGALQVFKFVDGDFGSGWGLDHGGIAEGVGGVGRC